MPKIKTNIPQVIWEILGKHPAIQKDISRGIINTRALAKYLIQRYTLNTSMDAVISAIRRYNLNKTYEEYNKAAENIFQNSNILTKSNMSCLTLEMNPNVLKTVISLHDILGPNQEVKVINSGKRIKLITNQKHLPRLEQELSKKNILKLEKDMAEIIIKLNMKAENTKGVMARMLNEILIHNINILEIVVCLPDIAIFVNQKDILKTHESLLKLSHSDIYDNLAITN